MKSATPASVRAATSSDCAAAAAGTSDLVPSITHSSPSRVAVVVMASRS